jgi:diguanylate cyclase (GGDEF)-like protein
LPARASVWLPANDQRHVIRAEEILMKDDHFPSERRRGLERRGLARRPSDLVRIPSWGEQRTQALTRYLFWALGLAYFNLGAAPRTSTLISLMLMNVVLLAYLAAITFFLWHAWRHPKAPSWRWRAAMWVDLAAITVATLADPVIVSPAILVYIVAIFGNGMRYGSRFFAEAVVGCFLLGLATPLLRFDDFMLALSMSTGYFLLFGGILVLYAYALTRGIEKIRQQLEVERSVDELTGLLNRRAMYERAESVFEGHTRKGDPVAVLFADLDRFKHVNDTQGHHVGDQVLSEIGQLLGEAVRRSDVLARFGGDEFILIMPATDLERATLVARRLQESLALWCRTRELDLSFSIGLGEAPMHGQDLKSLIERVDKAMYQSKLVFGRGGILRVEQPLPV